ncbi:MAG: hypothetical protein V7K67_09135 [Nostoc sp.]|uniref:hypothetical protein n=1 Tax=Nostoc sp. TaxID=1180 RepID=UPI002FF85F0B
MTTALQIIDGGNKRKRQKAEKAITRPHCKVSIDDVNWVRQQPPCVQQLWLDCVAAEQYGGAAHKLDTNLSRNSFLKASAVINGAALFEFEEVRSKTQSGRSGVTGFRVKNLHGYFNRHYWENFDNQPLTPESQAVTAENQQVMPQNHQMMSECQNLTFSEAQTNIQQEFQNPNHGANNSLTTYQQPTKVVGRVVGSDTQNENLHGEETAHTPLGGASPPHIESASEEEESPMATGCTTLALVDDAPSQPAPKRTENQDCGVEVRDCHVRAASRREGICSAAASIAEEEKELTQSEIFEWLDRADVGECPPLWVIQYLLDSKYYASMRATLSKFEKRWNVSVVNYQVQKLSEAIPATVNHAARSKVRPLRMEKLKMALMVGGEKLDFDFLQECWNDDPALRIIIKQMIAKYPEWGIVCVDGVLVDWNKE